MDAIQDIREFLCKEDRELAQLLFEMDLQFQSEDRENVAISVVKDLVPRAGMVDGELIEGQAVLLGYRPH